MKVDELKQQKDIRDYLLKFFTDPRFLVVKDAFVSHIPSGDTGNENSTSVAHGKCLGTAYVFNTIEEIAKTIPQKQTKKDGDAHKPDPDLES